MHLLVALNLKTSWIDYVRDKKKKIFLAILLWKMVSDADDGCHASLSDFSFI